MVGDPDADHHVVIVGCGFGGLFAARALKRAPVRVTIIDRTNHHPSNPSCTRWPPGSSEGQIAPAIRDVLRPDALRVVLAEVREIDFAARTIHADEFGRPQIMNTTASSSPAVPPPPTTGTTSSAGTPTA